MKIQFDLFLKSILFILMIALFISALILVWVRHENRQVFIQLQRLQQQQDQLNQEWTQLHLEYRTWTHTHRIDTLAREQLHMHLPHPQQKKWIKP